MGPPNEVVRIYRACIMCNEFGGVSKEKILGKFEILSHFKYSQFKTINTAIYLAIKYGQ